MERKFVGSFAISTVKYGNVFETSVLDKYGRIVKAYSDFTFENAKNTFNHFVYVFSKANGKGV